MAKKGTIYLIPNTLGDCDIDNLFPQYNYVVIRKLHHFIVEDVRTVRRFLKKVDKDIDIDSLTFYTLNKHPQNYLYYHHKFGGKINDTDPEPCQTVRQQVCSG